MRVNSPPEAKVEKLRVGLIGCGSMGASLAKACAGLERAEVVAVSDIVAEAAEKLGHELGAEAYADNGDKLLGRDDIAGILRYAHADEVGWGFAALEQGLHAGKIAKERPARLRPGLVPPEMRAPPAHAHARPKAVIERLMHPVMQE